MTPMCVTAQMAEPVVCYGDGRHLDSLLAWCVFRRRERAGDDLPDPQHADWPVDFDLPLARWETPLSGRCQARLLDGGKLWGWRASDAQWGDYIEGSYALRKMPDVDQFVRHTTAARHKMSTGSLKAKNKTYPIRFTHQIHWYAKGDIDTVRDLLVELTHLGKLANLGLGRIQSWSVEPVGDDRSVCHDGRLMRRMPASWCEARRAPNRGAVRPPYWHPSREVAETYPAGTEVA